MPAGQRRRNLYRRGDFRPTSVLSSPRFQVEAPLSTRCVLIWTRALDRVSRRPDEHRPVRTDMSRRLACFSSLPAGRGGQLERLCKPICCQVLYVHTRQHIQISNCSAGICTFTTVYTANGYKKHGQRRIRNRYRFLRLTCHVLPPFLNIKYFSLIK
jgi:hypothetical protein